MSTLPLNFDPAGRHLPVGSRWRRPGCDPVVDWWADVIVTKHDGAGFYAISPAAAVLGKRDSDTMPERWIGRLGLRDYERVEAP